jgi:hypothetical protein
VVVSCSRRSDRVALKEMIRDGGDSGEAVGQTYYSNILLNLFDYFLKSVGFLPILAVGFL